MSTGPLDVQGAPIYVEPRHPAFTAVSQMFFQLETNRFHLWPLPVVHFLESQTPGSSLTVATDLVHSRLQQSDMATDAVIVRQSLQRLSDFVATENSPDVIGAVAREVWDISRERDKLLIAIARLFEALATNRLGDELGFRKSVAMAIVSAASDEDLKPLPAAVLELAQKVFVAAA